MPGILPVDEPHALAGVDEVLAERVAVAGREGGGMGVERLRTTLRLRDGVVVAVGQGGIEIGEDLEVVVDHREDLEAEGECRRRWHGARGTPARRARERRGQSRRARASSCDHRRGA
jgi:hypothetical protein